jgi:hypothetical protein
VALVSLTWELGLIELAFRCEGIYWSEQWKATGRECCLRMLACLLWRDSESKEEVYISLNFSAWFLQVILRASFITMLLDIGDDDTDYPPSVHLEVPPPYIVISYFFVSFSQVWIYLFVTVKTECLELLYLF